MQLKYTGMKCYRCVTSTSDYNIVVVSECSNKFQLYEMNTGMLLHKGQVKSNIKALHLNIDSTSLWIGDSEGFVYVVDVKTGSTVWKSDKRLGEEGEVKWIESVGDRVVCGVGNKEENDHVAGVSTLHVLCKNNNNRHQVMMVVILILNLLVLIKENVLM